MKIKCQGKEKHFFLSPDIFCSLDNSVGLPNLIPGDIWQCLETSFIVTAEICVCVCVCVCVCELPACSQWELGKLANTLQCKGPLHHPIPSCELWDPKCQ